MGLQLKRTKTGIEWISDGRERERKRMGERKRMKERGREEEKEVKETVKWTSSQMTVFDFLLFLFSSFLSIIRFFKREKRNTLNADDASHSPSQILSFFLYFFLSISLSL